MGEAGLKEQDAISAKSFSQPKMSRVIKGKCVDSNPQHEGFNFVLYLLEFCGSHFSKPINGAGNVTLGCHVLLEVVD